MQHRIKQGLSKIRIKRIDNFKFCEREVRANLVYRVFTFTRIGDEKVPDAKTLARLGQAIGPRVIRELHERLMELARERGVVQGRKMRVDTTVVETHIHYPTASGLLGDGARVLTRTMKKVEKATGGLKKRSWHCLRHTFASRLVMAGIDLRTVQELLGHKSIAMTVRYSHLAPAHTLAAVERLAGNSPAQPTGTRTGTAVNPSITASIGGVQ
jgi:integrase